jgi:CCR4-NOT complex subunit CAF16
MGNTREAEEENVVEVSDLEFAYPGQNPFISKFSLKLKPGARCLLIGANGAG